jgi:hypothetical protein
MVRRQQRPDPEDQLLVSRPLSHERARSFLKYGVRLRYAEIEPACRTMLRPRP